jgi:hypothetical protein
MEKVAAVAGEVAQQFRERSVPTRWGNLQDRGRRFWVGVCVIASWNSGLGENAWPQMLMCFKAGTAQPSDLLFGSLRSGCLGHFSPLAPRSWPSGSVWSPSAPARRRGWRAARPALTTPASGLRNQSVARSTSQPAPDEAAIEAAMPQAHVVFKELVRLLGEQLYFAGDAVSLAADPAPHPRRSQGRRADGS